MNGSSSTFSFFMNLFLVLQVGVNYDPMIAKVVTHAEDRAAALRAMHAALGGLQVGAPNTRLAARLLLGTY